MPTAVRLFCSPPITQGPVLGRMMHTRREGQAVVPVLVKVCVTVCLEAWVLSSVGDARSGLGFFGGSAAWSLDSLPSPRTLWGVPPAPSSPCRWSQQSFALLPLVQLQVMRFTAGRAVFSCFVFVGLKRQGLNLEPRACVRAKSPGAEVQLQPFE